MKKGANSEKALNKNALSEALISIDKVFMHQIVVVETLSSKKCVNFRVG